MSIMCIYIFNASTYQQVLSTKQDMVGTNCDNSEVLESKQRILLKEFTQ